jgi:hypothetical protein
MSHPSHPSPDSTPPNRKRLGSYLIEAGLLTPAQVDVALNDQKLTGMRFGEILDMRGWVKQQTVDFIMRKVIVPERQALAQAQRVKQPAQRPATVSEPVPEAPAKVVERSRSEADAQLRRRDVPIAKPLPSVGSRDDGVNWVG